MDDLRKQRCRWSLLDLGALALALVSLSLVADGVAERWPITCWNLSQFTLSVELQSAPCAATARQRTYLWLSANRASIENAARKFRIDPIAIAGAIAYEALDDVHVSTVFGLTRSDGPGKVHYKALRFLIGVPVAGQVEEMGYLPVRTVRSRKQILQTAYGASLYIAAIMRAYADIAEQSANERIACSDGELVSLYAAYDIPHARSFFWLAPASARIINAAGSWVISNKAYLSKALGPSGVCKEVARAHFRRLAT